MQAWIVVGSQDNFELLRGRNFDIAAFKTSRRKQAAAMQPGDRLVFSLTKVVEFGGVVEVTSEAFEDDSDLGLRLGNGAADQPTRRGSHNSAYRDTGAGPIVGVRSARRPPATAALSPPDLPVPSESDQGRSSP